MLTSVKKKKILCKYRERLSVLRCFSTVVGNQFAYRHGNLPISIFPLNYNSCEHITEIVVDILPVIPDG